MTSRPALTAAALVFSALGAANAGEAAPPACLDMAETRQALAEGRATPLPTLARAMNGAPTGDILRARLCRHEGRLVYVLTLLRRDGQVVTQDVDAGTGAVGPARTPRPDRRLVGAAGDD